jgi:MAX-like protein X
MYLLQEMRRVCHINAEQKRRCNIQNGFQTLQGLIPHLSQSPTSKVNNKMKHFVYIHIKCI